MGRKRYKFESDTVLQDSIERGCVREIEMSDKRAAVDMKHNTRKYVYQGAEYTMAELSRTTGVRYGLLYDRISHGMAVEDAVRKPYCEKHTRKVVAARLDNELPYARDYKIQQIVADNPDGLNNEQIGAIIGTTRERVRQILDSALDKLRHNSEMIAANEASLPMWMHRW